MGKIGLNTVTHSTMNDIARECGISKMTVSRALTGHPGVSTPTREKILAAAQRLKYEVNTQAQNFARKRSGFIGVATPFRGLLGSNYFSELFEGLQIVLSDTDWDFALFDTLSSSFNDGGKLARLHRQRKVDGLLVVAPHTDDVFLETLTGLHIPLVVIGEKAHADVCSVFCNDQAGLTDLCLHLHALGHRRIAYVDGPNFLMSAKRRKQAYFEFCKKMNLRNPDWFIQRGDYTMRSGREAGLVLLKNDEPPTAIIAANDLMAYGVMESARELEIPIPGGISVAGFDDLPTASERCPSLTAIHQPVAKMGRRSAKLLLDAVVRGDLPSGHTEMEVSLVVRQSTGPPGFV